jgi:hypothetical protein
MPIGRVRPENERASELDSCSFVCLRAFSSRECEWRKFHFGARKCAPKAAAGAKSARICVHFRGQVRLDSPARVETPRNFASFGRN